MRLSGLTVVLLVSCFCTVYGFKFFDKTKLFQKKDKDRETVQVVTIHDSGEVEEIHHHRPHKKIIHKPVRVDRCDRNEVWYSCLPSCPITCDNLFKSCKAPGKCLQGCDCERGYARRTAKGSCERIDRCPNNGDSSEETCGKNEEYTDCGNSCNERCDDIVCPQICRKGCFCKRGYRRINGRCVEKDRCPADPGHEQCAKNEEFTMCGNPCKERCDAAVILCPAVCRKGCFCKNNYARIDGRCVKRDYCEDNSSPEDETCPKHESYKQCGKSCDEKCDSDRKPCSTKCKPGCFCDKGYVRIDGKCVSDRKCPKDEESCPKNEDYSECGWKCRESCDDATCLREKKPCKPGCFCNENYRRVNGKCVRKDQCDSSGGHSGEHGGHSGEHGGHSGEHGGHSGEHGGHSGEHGGHSGEHGGHSGEHSGEHEKCPRDKNEVYKRCGKTCDETCDPTKEPCSTKCKEGCFCRSGYYRVNGKCQKGSVCNKKKCTGRYEEYQTCGNTCENSCWFKGRECSTACESGCFCKKNFKRIGTDCWPKDQCDTLNID